MTYKRTEEQRQRIDQLIEALQSGKYKKATNSLKKGDGMCCLGVGCEIVREEVHGRWAMPSEIGPEYFVVGEDHDTKSGDGYCGLGIMPIKIAEMYGLDTVKNDMLGQIGGSYYLDMAALTVLNDLHVGDSWEGSGVIEKLIEFRDEQSDR
jgi:hypothetical protein